MDQEQKQNSIPVKDIMTTKITAAQAGDSVLAVASLMMDKGFDGVPVVDRGRRLLGMITMKELLDSKGFYIPTVMQLLRHLNITPSSEAADLYRQLLSLKNLKAESVMNTSPVTLDPGATIEQAMEAFLVHHIDSLPVVDTDKNLIGIVTKYDLLKKLTGPFTVIAARPDLTAESNLDEIAADVKRELVLITKQRKRLWFFVSMIFLVLGVLLALTLIIRVNII